MTQEWISAASWSGSSGRRVSSGRDHRDSSVSRSQSVTIGTRSPAAQAASWSWWWMSARVAVGAHRHHPATGLAVGQVPHVAGDRAAVALVGQARVGAGAPHAVAVSGDRERGHLGRLEPVQLERVHRRHDVRVAPGRRVLPAVLEREPGQSRHVDAVRRARGRQPRQGQRDPGGHVEPGREQRRVLRLVERREHRVGGDPAYQRRAPGGEGRGRRGVGVHPAVPVVELPRHQPTKLLGGQ